MYAQPVQNSSHGNTAVRDITLTYTVAALKLFYLEYMAGRSSGKYMASHPSWFRKQKGFQYDRSNSSENCVYC